MHRHNCVHQFFLTSDVTECETPLGPGPILVASVTVVQVSIRADVELGTDQAKENDAKAKAIDVAVEVK